MAELPLMRIRVAKAKKADGSTDDFDVVRDLTVGADADVEDDLTVGGDIDVTGDVGGATATISGNATVGGTLGVTGNTTLGGNLAVSGNITGGSIVENMSGYSFSKQTVTGYELNYIYAGACKNGNKLTLALAMKIKRTDNDAGSTLVIGEFPVPQAILDLLYPFNIGGSNLLAKIQCNASTSYSDDGVNCPVWTQKGVSYISIGIDTSSLTTGTDYYLRFDQTFLLSDNLAA